MIKTLIVDDNLTFAKNLLNSSVSKLKNIQLIYCAATYQESMNIILKNQIDLILLDLNLPDGTGNSIIENINLMNDIKKPKIIVISSDISLINKLKNKTNIFRIINKTEGLKIIYEKLEKIVQDIQFENNYNEIEQITLNELINFGYNIKYIGTTYILEAIMYIYSCNDWDLINNLEKNVYKYIGFKHQKNINNIKTNIIKATNQREKNKMREIELTPKLTINNILLKINREVN